MAIRLRLSVTMPLTGMGTGSCEAADLLARPSSARGQCYTVHSCERNTNAFTLQVLCIQIPLGLRVYRGDLGL